MKVQRQGRLFLLAILALPGLPALSATPPESGSGHEVVALDEAIRTALRNNFAYRIAALEPEIARESITTAEAAFETELFAAGRVAQAEQSTTFSQTTGTSSDNRWWEVGARKRFSYGTSVTAQTNLDRRDSNAGVNTSNLSQSADLSLNLRQPLLRGFGRAANTSGIESATAGYRASVEAYRDTLLSVLAETERAYWNVARLQEQLSLNESSLEVAEVLLEEARERERVGVATRIEVLQAEAERALRMEEIIASRRALGDAIDQLFVYMGSVAPGMGLSADSLPRVSTLPESGKAAPEFRQVWNLAVKADPDLARQEEVISQREWERLAARSDVKPNLDLVLSGAYTGVDDREAENAYEDAIDRDGHAWAVGVEFSMPWRLSGEKAALRAAEKRLEQETLRYDELKQDLFREVRSTWRNLDALTQSVEAAQLTVSLQEATFERERSKYEEGLSVFRDVLETRRDLDQARIRLLRSRFEKLSAEIELARLSGRLMQRHGLDPEALLPSR